MLQKSRVTNINLDICVTKYFCLCQVQWEKGPQVTVWLYYAIFHLQVTPLLQWFEAYGETLPSNSYVLFTDAFDTGMVGNASNIVQRFLGISSIISLSNLTKILSHISKGGGG